jgi:hypothetical protein
LASQLLSINVSNNADVLAQLSVKLAPPSAGGSAIPPDADDLALQLRTIKLSDDAAVLDDMSARLRRDGIFAIEDLQGLSLDELKKTVATLNLNAVQLKRLFAAVSKP